MPYTKHTYTTCTHNTHLTQHPCTFTLVHTHMTHTHTHHTTTREQSTSQLFSDLGAASSATPKCQKFTARYINSLPVQESDLVPGECVKVVHACISKLQPNRESSAAIDKVKSVCVFGCVCVWVCGCVCVCGCVWVWCVWVWVCV